MIKKKTLDLITRRTGIKQKSLLEKDLILHRLLVELESIKQFRDNFAFKGGTCLMKCYFGYYRFSEDLDFTYINTKEFDGNSEKQTRKILSERISNLSKIIEEISNKIGLDFKSDKKDNRYVKFGGSNKFVTFKLWYVPEGGKQETFIKIEINFAEKLFYPVKEISANNIFFGKYEDFNLAFTLPEESEWLLKIPNLKCYSLEEILVEKIRAILTRKGVKGRDFLDVFLIVKQNKINLNDYKSNILKKIEFALKYEKYSINLSKKDLGFLDKFVLGEEESLLIQEMPKGLDSFLKEFKIFLEIIIKDIKNQ